MSDLPTMQHIRMFIAEKEKKEKDRKKEMCSYSCNRLTSWDSFYLMSK